MKRSVFNDYSRPTPPLSCGAEITLAAFIGGGNFCGVDAAKVACRAVGALTQLFGALKRVEFSRGTRFRLRKPTFAVVPFGTNFDVRSG